MLSDTANSGPFWSYTHKNGEVELSQTEFLLGNQYNEREDMRE